MCTAVAVRRLNGCAAGPTDNGGAHRDGLGVSTGAVAVPRTAESPAWTKLSALEQVEAVLTSRSMTSMATVLDATNPGRSGYPDLLLLTIRTLCGVFGSQAETLQMLQDPDIWARVTRHYSRRHGEAFAMSIPQRPPTARIMDGFCERVASDDALMRQLEDRFTWAACNMAVAMGMFSSDAPVDYANPSLDHSVLGDGSYLAPLSDVRQVLIPGTKDLVTVGSRSKYNRPRLPGILTDAKADRKKATGINHVTLSALSGHGFIVLATTQAMGAERYGAQRLLERVHDVLGARMHHVVWDRVITGWLLEWTMAALHCSVVNKAVALGDRKTAHPNIRISAAIAQELHQSGQPLPLGVSVYPTTKGSDVIYSNYVPYGPIEGLDCSHDLWVDDGALVDVVTQVAGHRYKRARAVATSSTGEAVGDRWVVTTHWELPCPDAPNGRHEFTTEWRPRLNKNQHLPGPAHVALSEIRVVPRLDPEQFSRVGGRRNVTESLNNWMKSRLGRGTNAGRAMRLTREGQRLDHLCLGLLANSITEFRARSAK